MEKIQTDQRCLSLSGLSRLELNYLELFVFLNINGMDPKNNDSGFEYDMVIKFTI